MAGSILGGLVRIVDHGDPMRSEVTLLVSSLLTLGIPPVGEDYFECTGEFNRGATTWQTAWNLRDESKDGRYETARMQTAWHNPAWLLAHPQHPLAILRGGLTLQRALSLTPRFTAAELASIETPDTWIEAGCRNLIGLLRDLPRASQSARKIIRFAPRHCAGVPRNLPDAQASRFLRFVENPSKRHQFA